MLTYLSESVIVTADAAGSLRAFANVCRHRGSQVVPVEAGAAVEPCDAKSLRCPYHSWTYGLDGRLMHAPHTDDVDLGHVDIRPEAIARIRLGWVPLAHRGSGRARRGRRALNPVPDRVRRYPLATLWSACGSCITVAANWKVLAENYNECYHCGPVHPELCQLVPAFRQAAATTSTGRTASRTGSGAWTFTLSRHDPPPTVPGAQRGRADRHKGELVYPNLLAEPLGRPRRGVHAVAASPPTAPTITFDLLFQPDAVAKPDFDPGTPSISGTS